MASLCIQFRFASIPNELKDSFQKIARNCRKMWTLRGFSLVLVILPFSANAQLDPLKVAQKQAAINLPPCRLCKTFVDSFQKVNYRN